MINGSKISGNVLQLLFDVNRKGMEVEWTGATVYVVASRRRDGRPEKAVAIGPEYASTPSQRFYTVDEIREYLGV